MRFMQFRLQLDEDSGYIIGNAEPAVDGGVQSDQVQVPGIKMFIEQCDPPISEFIKEFEFNEDNWLNSEFRACYQQTLLGKSTGWKLASVKVWFGLLLLEFVSERRYQELLQNGDADSDSPYYNETVSFSPRTNDSYVKLRLEVKSPEHDGDDIFYITMSKQRTEVIECLSGQKCKIEFLPRRKRDCHERSQQWVNIQWYC